MPLPGERPSAKIAKLFPQTDPLKNQQKDQNNGAKPAEAATAAVAQAPGAQSVPLPEARPAIAPSRHSRRHRYYHRYRNAR
jgi:membrane-bound lytic murein transglycosylase A